VRSEQMCEQMGYHTNEYRGAAIGLLGSDNCCGKALVSIDSTLG